MACSFCFYFKHSKLNVLNFNNKIKVCSPLDPANPLEHRLVLSIYTVYVSGKKLSQGGHGAIFSKPKKMARIQYGKIYPNSLENEIKVT